MDFTFKANKTNQRIYRYEKTCYKKSPNYYSVEYIEPHTDTWMVIGRADTPEQAEQMIKQHKLGK